MKKLLTILLAFMYLSISSGVVYNVHYCMGEVANVALGSKTGEKCATCGMDNKGCCHDDIQVIKLKDDHSPSAVQISIAKYTAMAAEYPVWISEHQLSSTSNYFQPLYDPPPQVEKNILHCVFRI